MSVKCGCTQIQPVLHLETADLCVNFLGQTLTITTELFILASGHFDGFHWSALYSFEIKEINTKDSAIVFQLSYKIHIGLIITVPGHTRQDLCCIS